MSTPPPYPGAPSPWPVQPARPTTRMPSTVSRWLRPLYVAAAALPLTVLTVAALFMPWAKGTGSANDRVYVSVASNGFGHVVTNEGQTRILAGYLVVGLLVLVLVLGATALLTATKAQRLGAAVLGVGGLLEVVIALVALISGMGRSHGFGIVSSEKWGSYFWEIDYTSSAGAGAVLTLVIGLLVLALGVLYLVIRPSASQPPYADLVDRLRTDQHSQA